MLDYQRILDDVHAVLDSGGDRPDLLRETAADYRAACEEANERLRRCEGLLRRGLRSEAIQQAETEPVLLDVVAQLDFSDRQAWCNLLAQHGIAPPPLLAIELAAELNEAYAVEHRWPACSTSIGCSLLPAVRSGAGFKCSGSSASWTRRIRSGAKT